MYLVQSPTDGEWYRAKVISLGERDAFTVMYVDYGNNETLLNTPETVSISLRLRSIYCIHVFIHIGKY